MLLKVAAMTQVKISVLHILPRDNLYVLLKKSPLIARSVWSPHSEV